MGESQKNLYITEADPVPGVGVGNFQWEPLDPDHQHYTVAISCRDGQFNEDWQIARVNGVLRTEITIERATPWIERNPELERSVFKCADQPLFGAAQNVNLRRRHIEINPGWKPNHVFTVPVVIVDPNKNLEVMKTHDMGCWEILTQHLGEAHLPLTLSSQNPIALVVVIYGFLVLVFPLYWLFALWIMDVPNLITSSHENS